MRLPSLIVVAVLALLGLLAVSSASSHEIPFNYPGLSHDETMKLKSNAENHTFQTEVSRLMKLIINSLYKTKEIFLRELISNASDALDKIRFKSLKDPSVLGSTSDLKISIVADAENKTLTITDTGIGMTKADLKKHLGTIARSGTAEFIEQLEKKKDDIGLIGQFGVGFYSVFLIADTVSVTTKHNDDEQYIWESDSENGFTIVKDPRGNTLGRGTQITMYLKSDASEFLEESRLRGLIEKYSEFINFPIYLYTTKTVTEEVPIEDNEENQEESRPDEDTENKEENVNDDVEVQEKSSVDEQEKKPKAKTLEKTVQEFEQINVNKPIWTRPSSEVTEEEYNKFYQSFFKDTADPFGFTHFKAEGEVEFKSILYIPKNAPFNILKNPKPDSLKNIKLFVKRVFITDELVDFLPRYLAFLRGLVDSDDFPLNVSRETLQHSKTLDTVKRKIISKALDLLKKTCASKEKCDKLMSEYSANLKVGVLEDKQNSKKLLNLLRWTSSYGDNSTSLAEYTDRMKKGQEDIYYISGSSVEEVKKSPFLEKLVSKGYEVLYFVDPIDEYVFQQRDYNGMKFQNAAKAGLKFGDEDEEFKKSLEEMQSKFKPLSNYFEKLFSSTIEKVTITNRLTKSPIAIVANEFGASPQYERMMQAQAKQNDPMSSWVLSQKKIIEINPYHPLMEALLARVEDEKMGGEEENLVKVLVDGAMVASGWQLKDTTGFAARVERAVRKALGVDLESQAKVEVKKAEERDKTEKEIKVAEMEENEEILDEENSTRDEL